MRTLLMIAVAAVLLPGAAPANESRAYAEAEQAVAAFRDRTFLPTACERAFSRFWKAFREPGNDRLVYTTDRFGVEEYFGFGNPSATSLLAEAQALCRDEAGRHGDMVLRVLRDREIVKERKLHQFEHAERTIGQ